MTDTAITPLEDEKSLSIEAAMREQGAAIDESVQEDYFDFEEIYVVMFPDGVTFVQCKALNEGGRKKYLTKVNRDVRVQRATGDAIMKMSPGEERTALLTESFVGWNLVRGKKGQPKVAVPFTPNEVMKFIDGTNPKLLDLIEKEVRKHNEWLQAGMTVEDIDKEIERLEELKVQVQKDEEGKAS